MNVWIQVEVPDGHEVEVRSIVSSVGDALATAVHTIDHRCSAEVWTNAELATHFGASSAGPEGGSTDG